MMLVSISLSLNLLLLLVFILKSKKIDKNLALLNEKIKVTARNPPGAHKKFQNNEW